MKPDRNKTRARRLNDLLVRRYISAFDPRSATACAETISVFVVADRSTNTGNHNAMVHSRENDHYDIALRTQHQQGNTV